MKIRSNKTVVFDNIRFIKDEITEITEKEYNNLKVGMVWYFEQGILTIEKKESKK